MTNNPENQRMVKELVEDTLLYKAPGHEAFLAELPFLNDDQLQLAYDQCFVMWKDDDLELV